MILCPKCRMSLHRRSNQSDLDSLFLVCPNCGGVWHVPITLLESGQGDLKDFAVTDEKTIRRALDGMRV